MTIPWLRLSTRVAHFLGVTLPEETDFEVWVFQKSQLTEIFRALKALPNFRFTKFILPGWVGIEQTELTLGQRGNGLVNLDILEPLRFFPRLFDCPAFLNRFFS